MTVIELIKQLSMMKPNARVFHLWNGELRTEINHVYMGQEGHCVTADNSEISYSNSGRPINAPTKLVDDSWRTPKKNK